MTSLDGLGLHVFGCQQLVFQGCDVGDALLLESLKPCIKGFLWVEERQSDLAVKLERI